jgi:hypothetical protein
MLDQRLREIAANLYGASATDDDILMLRSEFPPRLTPDWFMSMLKHHKLAGVRVSLTTEHDRSGLGADIIWLSPREMVSEARDVEPGISVASSGFLPIGGCAEGSGDPYFLDLRESSNDPPVVRIPHDYATQVPYPLDRIDVVSWSLSEFFSNASI